MVSIDALASAPVLRALGLVAAVPLARALLHFTIFKPIGTRLLARTEQQRASGRLPPKADHRRKKLSESLWKITAYVLLASLGLFALHDRPWALHTAEWWRGHPHQTLEPKVEAYYNAELAFYGASLALLLMWEERRHDFLVMLTHHVVTIALIAFSYHARFTRVGAVVMLLHDPSDICLEAAKACQYVGWERASVAFFVLLLLSWLLLRLVVFPLWLIRSAMFEVAQVLGGYPPHSAAFIAMLCSLVCMHAYWFALIARIAWLKLTTGEGRDVREDDD